MEDEQKKKYRCSTAAETLEWIKAILDFLQPYTFFYQANVVNFLKDRLWEAVDEDWIACLVTEPVEHLLKIPSGLVQDHWPASLKNYILTAKLLAFPREQAKLQEVLIGISVSTLNNVLSQGMNPKKKHEVEILSSVVNCFSRKVGANVVIDVGAGQGYLTQVLAFQYQLPVVAIDACSHHGVVTNKRAERIKKHFLAKQHNFGLEMGLPNMPKTVTCRVLSSSMLKKLTMYGCQHDDFDEKAPFEKCNIDICEARPKVGVESLPRDGANADRGSSLVLAGLHACGDLSVTMLRAFAECEEVKAVVSVGCCYNLLSEYGSENAGSDAGFPVSNRLKIMGVSLGKSARDLACQSAERWGYLEKDAGVQNFELHAFRAAFQMILDRYYPEVLGRSPSIGRQGKALRRQQKRGSTGTSESAQNEKSTSRTGLSAVGSQGTGIDRKGRPDKYNLFEKFSSSGLSYLGLEPVQDLDLHGLWTEWQPFSELIGPYWSLRAALGPLLETLILLDRLLFLQEQGNGFEVDVLPIFDPIVSPRNLAIVACKSSLYYKK